MNFATAFSSRSTHASLPWGCANSGLLVPLLQGIQSSTVTFTHFPPGFSGNLSNSLTVYLPYALYCTAM